MIREIYNKIIEDKVINLRFNFLRQNKCFCSKDKKICDCYKEHIELIKIFIDSRILSEYVIIRNKVCYNNRCYNKIVSYFIGIINDDIACNNKLINEIKNDPHYEENDYLKFEIINKNLELLKKTLLEKNMSYI